MKDGAGIHRRPRSDLNREDLGTKSTIDRNDALFIRHVFALILRKSQNDRADMLCVTPTPFSQGGRIQNADFILIVEQAPHKIFQRQIGPGQFIGRNRLGDGGDMFPFGVIMARMQPVPPDFAFGQMLNENAARDITR